MKPASAWIISSKFLQTAECCRYAAGESAATIVLQEEEDDTLVAGPEIRVRGDFSRYHYTFHLDTGDKIAQVNYKL